MRMIHGKQVMDTLEEIVDPRHTALIVVDVQNDFCSPEGAAGRLGRNLSAMPAMIARLQRLLEESRRQGLLRVFVQAASLPNGQSDSPAWLYRNLAKGLQRSSEAEEFCAPGTWGHEVVAELAPLPEEVRVRKHRSSAFHRTDLDLVLRSNGIKTVIVTGVVTEGCVDSTVRDALFHDYYAVLPRDCVASRNQAYHEASLLISKADLVEAEELGRAWAGLGAPARRGG